MGTPGGQRGKVEETGWARTSVTVPGRAGSGAYCFADSVPYRFVGIASGYLIVFGGAASMSPTVAGGCSKNRLPVAMARKPV